MITVSEPMAPPRWALLERHLIDSIAEACRVFYDRYFDEQGYLECVPRWGGLDGADDAAENVAAFPDLYALGGPRDVYDLFRQGIEGHIRQYTEAKTTVTELGRDGMYYKEYPTCFDPLHNGEGYHCLFQQGLCEPWDPVYRKRMKRFAGFYLPGDPDEPPEPNYDPEHRIIRSTMTGSRGPLLRTATAADWCGDPFEIPGRFHPGRGHRDYDDYVVHYEQHYPDVVGDGPMNLALNVWALHAYMLDGESKYRDWLLEYADGWLERTRANDNIVPANVGLDGTLGGSYGGRWWRGVFGWAHTCERPYFRHNCAFPDRVTYGWANALYLTGDRAYVEVWRDVIDAVNSHARQDRGLTLYPRMRGDDGWYAFEPTPWNRGALELYYWTLDPRDRERVSDHPWIAFLDGRNPEFPAQRLEWALATVRERIARVRADTSTRDTRLSEDPNGLNPAEMVWPLVQLMLGGLPTRHIGVPWHTRVRYFDPERGRSGIPEQVASLVTGFAPGEDGADSVELTLVNLDPVRPRTLVLQAGAYGESRIRSVTAGGTRIPVDDRATVVHLRPGAGAQLTLAIERYVEQPTLAFPASASASPPGLG